MVLQAHTMRVTYEQIYAIKHRDLSKPLAILVKNFEDLPKYINISEEQIRFSEPIPILGVVSQNARVMPRFQRSSEQIANIKSLSLRVAEVCIPEMIRDTLPYPLFLTSANHSGEKEAHTLEEAKSIIQDSSIKVQSFDGGYVINLGRIFLISWSDPMKKSTCVENYF
jgi:tRNA A37 threonylcarbamoyladenosine synthetase subunit TsaC/SUA5/YrdC